MNLLSKKQIRYAMACSIILAQTCLLQGTLETGNRFHRFLDYLAQSHLAHRFNQLMIPIDQENMKRVALEPASSEWQQLAEEAQRALGIPKDRHVPILFDAKRDGGMATSYAVLIGEYEDSSYGAKRCDVFHEYSHTKHHDLSCQTPVLLTPLLSTPLLCKLLVNPQGRYKLLYLVFLIAGYYVGKLLQDNHANYYERRADIEGHYATQCHICVTEKADSLESVCTELKNYLTVLEPFYDVLPDDLKRGIDGAKAFLKTKESYLTVAENRAIAADLRRDNKVCSFHGQNHQKKTLIRSAL